MSIKNSIQTISWQTFIVWQTKLLTKIIQNRDKMFLENPKNMCYCYSVLQDSYDKIKKIALDIIFIQELQVFNIIAPNSWLIIDDLDGYFQEWSQEMLQLFTVRSHHEKISVTPCSTKSRSSE